MHCAQVQRNATNLQRQRNYKENNLLPCIVTSTCEPVKQHTSSLQVCSVLILGGTAQAGYSLCRSVVRPSVRLSAECMLCKMAEWIQMLCGVRNCRDTTSYVWEGAVEIGANSIWFE